MRNKYYATANTVVIVTEIGDTDRYSRKDWNHIIDSHPELTAEYMDDPDQLYYCGKNKSGFESEVGQDGYYVVYAYLLKKRNGVERYARRRKQLIDIFSSINALFQAFQEGGTYFGHQESRLLGHAEYSIYRYRLEEGDLRKHYSIARQKALYIQSLRQMIEDEATDTNHSPGFDKASFRKELNAKVDLIERSITDLFNLRQAQDFQYRHYQYY